MVKSTLAVFAASLLITIPAGRQAPQQHLEETRRLNRAGHPVGPSSGTNMVVARRMAADGLTVLTFFPDRIDRYRSLPEFKDV